MFRNAMLLYVKVRLVRHHGYWYNHCSEIDVAALLLFQIFPYFKQEDQTMFDVLKGEGSLCFLEGPLGPSVFPNASTKLLYRI